MYVCMYLRVCMYVYLAMYVFVDPMNDVDGNAYDDVIIKPRRQRKADEESPYVCCNDD